MYPAYHTISHIYLHSVPYAFGCVLSAVYDDDTLKCHIPGQECRPAYIDVSHMACHMYTYVCGVIRYVTSRVIYAMTCVIYLYGLPYVIPCMYMSYILAGIKPDDKNLMNVAKSYGYVLSLPHLSIPSYFALPQKFYLKKRVIPLC